MARILLELYSRKTPENLISLLNESFDKVYFLCPSNLFAPTKSEKEELSKILLCLQGISPEFFILSDSQIESALSAFKSIYKEENTYEIDITGGTEPFIAAAGIFQTRAKEGTVFLHKYDVKSGKLLFRYPNLSPYKRPHPCHLSVPQFLALGGNPPITAPFFSFENGLLEKEIRRLWNAVKGNLKEWNRYCSLSSDPRTEEHSVYQKFLDSEKSIRTYRIISGKLKKAGILSGERFTKLGAKELVDFSLDIPKEVEFLYDKAGSLLELYGALAAYKSGNFHDIRVGVILDWDGKIASPDTPDPRNEVDLFLMHNNLPVLISCKNTVPENEHLYEIMIMAKHYGGFFSTPVLFSSGKASLTVKKRAKEMGIILIDSVSTLSLGAISARLQKEFS